MANNLMQYIYCFVVLSVCVDRGDGRWKRRNDAHNIQHDIEVFRQMADKIEHEIDDFYDEYLEEEAGVDSDRKTNYEYVQNTHYRDSRTKVASKQDETLFQENDISSSENNTSQKLINKDININKTLYTHVSFKNDEKSITKWPKFEEILLEMGKKYDWKNDRWIKVKEKLKVQSNEVNVIHNEVDFHDRHKFSYKIVKLNRNKRRNVIVAVSAVR